MIPDVSDALADWVSAYTFNTVTQQTADFIETNIETPRTVQALIQPADKEALKIAEINWSLQYITIHALSDVVVGDLATFDGRQFKVVSSAGWLAYGYVEAVGEEVK